MKTASARLPILLLAALVFSACQLPLAGSQTGRIEVRNPYADAAQRKAGVPLVAFPQNLLTNLDHYVLKVLTTGGDPIGSIPDQSIAPGSPVFSVDRVAPGDYLLVLEAWSTGPVKTAESSQLITVTSGTVTTIDTMVLVPVVSGGDGTFAFSLTIASGFGDLATTGQLSATLSHLNYSTGSLTGVPTLLDSALFTFTPSASSLDFATTSSLPAGNYLITLQRASASLAAPAPIPVVGIVVQVFPGQVSSIGPAAVPDGWLDSAPTPPLGVHAEMDPLGDIYVSWDAPLAHLTTTFYQVGYAFKETDLVPEATLSLASGSGDLVIGANLERTGARFRVKVTAGTPPFNNAGDSQVALFVRSVSGQSTPSAWTIVTLDPTSLVRPRPIPALVFWDLKPGATYELQKRASDSSVLESFPLTVTASDPSIAPPPTTFSVPGLAVAAGESLVVSLHHPDGSTTDTPIALDAVNTMDSSIAYDPAAPYYAYLATRDPEGSPVDTWILLEDPDYPTANSAALDPPPSVILDDPEGLVLSWTSTDLGGSHLTRTGWTPETDSSQHPEKQVFGAEATGFSAIGPWDAEPGKITHYRVRAVYQYSFNAQQFEILGPPSAWVGYDLQPPALMVDSWIPAPPATVTSLDQLSAVFRYTDFQTENDVPTALVVRLWGWGDGAYTAATAPEVNPESFSTINGVTTWTAPASWSAIPVIPGQSYQLQILAYDARGNEATAGVAVKGGL